MFCVKLYDLKAIARVETSVERRPARQAGYCADVHDGRVVPEDLVMSEVGRASARVIVQRQAFVRMHLC